MFPSDQYVACLSRKSLLAGYLMLFSACFVCVLVVVLEVVLVSNKTVHHPALGKHHTSSLEDAINSVNSARKELGYTRLFCHYIYIYVLLKCNINFQTLYIFV